MSESEIGNEMPFLAILSSFCVLSVILNTIVIVVAVRANRIRVPLDFFMVNLAVSDLLLGGIALPIKLTNAARQGEDFYGGDVVCKMVQFLPLFTIMSSISTMTIMALDKYRTLVKHKYLTNSQLYIIVIIIWVVSLGTSAPQLYEYSVYEKQMKTTNTTMLACGSHGIVEDFELIYSVIILIIAYLIPVMIIISSYIFLMVFICKMSKRIDNAINGPDGAQTRRGVVSKKKRKVIGMLITITIVFTILWAPYFITFTIEEIMGMDDTSEAGSLSHSIGQTMIVLSTLSNPVIYCCFNQEFRKRAFDQVTCCCKKSPSNRVFQGPQDESLEA